MPSSEKLAQFVQALSLPRHPRPRTYQFKTYDLSFSVNERPEIIGVNVSYVSVSIALIKIDTPVIFPPEVIPLRHLV